MTRWKPLEWKQNQSDVFNWFNMARRKIRPIFVGKKGIKVNAKKNIENLLQTHLFPGINRIYARNDWIFLQECASSRTSYLVQSVLKATISRCFIFRSMTPELTWYEPSWLLFLEWSYKWIRTEWKILLKIKKKSLRESNQFGTIVRQILNHSESQWNNSHRDFKLRRRWMAFSMKIRFG